MSLSTRLLLTLLAFFGATGCTALAPQTPFANRIASTDLQATPPASFNTAIPQFELTKLALAPEEPAENQRLDLPDLIDLAQRNNPLTRIAWNEAQQAAIAAGMVKATYLPLLTANVIGGYRRSKNDDSLNIGFIGLDWKSHTTVKGVVPSLNLAWLLFDFGEREALHEAAQELAFASASKFTTVHQATVFNVTRTFYEFNTARQRTSLAQEHLKNTKALELAAQERYQMGVGTSIEVAQAKQLTAQANLHLVQRQAIERDSYQALLGAVGVRPDSKLHIAPNTQKALPLFEELPSYEALQQALAYRPDLIAVDAARRAAEKNIESARANFLPKVTLFGGIAAGKVNLSLQNIGDTSPQSNSTSVLLGITLPLFDGGLRRMHLHEAESRAAAAKELVRKTQNDALLEMHLAVNALRSALEAYNAASLLVQAAAITSEAATDAYKHGIGSMILATEASNGLLDAQEAQALAHSAAFIASANVSFVMGQINLSR